MKFSKKVSGYFYDQLLKSISELGLKDGLVKVLKLEPTTLAKRQSSRTPLQSDDGIKALVWLESLQFDAARDIANGFTNAILRDCKEDWLEAEKIRIRRLITQKLSVENDVRIGEPEICLLFVEFFEKFNHQELKKEIKKAIGKEEPSQFKANIKKYAKNASNAEKKGAKSPLFLFEHVVAMLNCCQPELSSLPLETLSLCRELVEKIEESYPCAIESLKIRSKDINLVTPEEILGNMRDLPIPHTFFGSSRYQQCTAPEQEAIQALLKMAGPPPL